MKLMKYLILFIGVSYADTTIVAFDAVHQSFGDLGNNRTVIDTIRFPESNSNFSEITMNVNLECPNGGCDPWDRKAKISVMHLEEWYEIGRYVTPYGVECGWSFDVTDYRSILKGEVPILSYIDTWVRPGWLVTIEFHFISGTPNYDYTAVRNIWNEDYVVYGDESIPINIPSVTEYIPMDAEAVYLRMITTGHGQGNTDNAAEFSYRVHEIHLDGEMEFLHDFWRSDCESNSCSPQNGTWQYDRAGFCPGDKVLHDDFYLEGNLFYGDTIKFDYVLEDYINYCSPNNPSCVDGTTCPQCNYNNNGHTEPFYFIASQLIIHSDSYHSNADTYFKLMVEDSLDNTIQLYLENYVPLYGFQLKIDLSGLQGTDVSDIEFQNGVGGRAEDSGWTIGVNDSGLVVGLAQQTGNPIPAGEGILTSFILDGIELSSLNGLIAISDLYASGYFGSDISSEIGSSIFFNPDLYATSLDFLPEMIRLYPAYPNPFNPSVKIPFDLNQENVVSLTVFNLQGKKVKDLISSKRMKSGKYIMEWDGSLSPSGMYFYSINTGKFFQTEKIILLK